MDDMKRCPYCGHLEELNAVFCTACGAKMEVTINAYQQEIEQTYGEQQSYNPSQSQQPFQKNNQYQNQEEQQQQYQNQQYNQGQQYQNQQYNPGQQYQNQQQYMPNNKKSRSKGLIIALVIGVLMLAIAIAVVAFVVPKYNDKNAKNEESMATQVETSEKTTELETTTQPETQPATPVPAVAPTEKDEEQTLAPIGYTDKELISAAKNYYIAVHGENPPHVDIDSSDEKTVTIHLYGETSTNTFTLDWYYVNRETGIGTDVLGDYINIMDLSSVQGDNYSSDNSEYILPNSDSQYLSMNDLKGMTAYECRIARNELFARYGRRFDDAELQSYFDSKSWYVGTIEPEDFDESIFNKYEFANRDLIIKYEKEQGYR